MFTCTFMNALPCDYIEIQPDANGVIHSGVLPGFQFRLADLQRLPLLEEMAFDEVYHAFVLPSYRVATERAVMAEERAFAAEEKVEQERQRAEQERQRAKQEHQRAEQEQRRAEQEVQHTIQERQRAERYAARLRELGVMVDEL